MTLSIFMLLAFNNVFLILMYLCYRFQEVYYVVILCVYVFIFKAVFTFYLLGSDNDIYLCDSNYKEDCKISINVDAIDCL